MKKSNTNNEIVLPLSNAITISKNPRIKMSSDNMKGFLFAGNNDFQNISSGTLITSSIYTGRNGGGVYLNEENLWQAFFLQTDVHSVREELKLNRPDVGWYQIRKALEARNESGDFPTVSFNAFKAAYENLTEKLRPMVYELGFLRS